MRSIVILFTLAIMRLLSAREILLVPNFEATDELFAYDEHASFHSLDNWQKISYLLNKNDCTIRLGDLDSLSKKSKKIKEHCEELKEADQTYLIVDYHRRFFKKLLPHMPPESVMLLVVEPPAVHDELHTTKCYAKFSKVITWDDVRVNNKNVFKYNLPVREEMTQDLVPFNEREFCCLFSANKKSGFRYELYSERRRAIHFFEIKHPHQFNLYGEGWEKEQLFVAKGRVDLKHENLKKHKFSICYENTTQINGYITEKIFDCFAAGVVPIYLGAINIKDYIPENCFIDRRNFSSYDVLYEYLSSISEDKFNQYLENIRQYLASLKSQEFSKDSYVISIVNAILDTDYTLDDLKELD